MSEMSSKTFIDGPSLLEQMGTVTPESMQTINGKPDCAHLARVRKTMGAVFKGLINSNDLHCNADYGYSHPVDTLTAHCTRIEKADVKQPKMPDCPVLADDADAKEE